METLAQARSVFGVSFRACGELISTARRTGVVGDALAVLTGGAVGVPLTNGSSSRIDVSLLYPTAS